MAQAPQDDDARRRRDQEEMASIPATFVDSFSVAWWSDGIRISLGEYLCEKRRFRLAVVMPLDDAEALGNTLLKSVKDARQKETES